MSSTEPPSGEVYPFHQGDDFLEEIGGNTAHGTKKDGDHRYSRGHNRRTTLALPTAADARWGGWPAARGGGWRGGGWGWGVGPGFALGLGLGAAPYYAYGGPYYGSYAYGGDCVMRRRAVINRWGHRVWRWYASVIERSKQQKSKRPGLPGRLCLVECHAPSCCTRN